MGLNIWRGRSCLVRGDLDDHHKAGNYVILAKINKLIVKNNWKRHESLESLKPSLPLSSLLALI